MERIAYVRSSSIYDDSRATKEIKALSKQGFFVEVFGWNRDGDASCECNNVFKNDENVRFYFYSCDAKGEWIAFLDSDDLWMPEKLEKQIEFMGKHSYALSFTEYEKIGEDDQPLNIHVSGPNVVNKRKMYNYDYIGQLSMMYNAKHFGLIQIKDIKKNNDYAIRLQL